MRQLYESNSVYHFLKQCLPFSMLAESTISLLFKESNILYLDNQAYIFEEGKPAKEHVFVVQRGTIELLSTQQDRTWLVDLCNEGDVFGARAVLAGGNYATSARAQSEALVIAISADRIKDLVATEAQFAHYFAVNFATTLPFRAKNLQETIRKSDNTLDQHENFLATRSLSVQPDVITCVESMLVKEAALMMYQKKIGALIVVNESRHPIGIITNTDFRDKVAAIGLQVEQCFVREIMSSPVKTFTLPLSLMDGISCIMHDGIRHFCFTEDGTPNSPVVGISSERDLIYAIGALPNGIVSAIREAMHLRQLPPICNQIEELASRYIEGGADVRNLQQIISPLWDRITQKIIALTIAELEEIGMGKPPKPFCWLLFGSSGRKEQVIRTDQDNGIVINEDDLTQNEQLYFEIFAEKVVDALESCGFEKCPGKVMATNQKWRVSVEKWEQYFKGWIQEHSLEALMHTSIFFDLRPIYGDEQLAKRIKTSIHHEWQKNEIFTSLLAKNTLLNPLPLTFFKSFIVEKDGEHAHQFDIKTRAIMPIVEIARLLAYDYYLPDSLSTRDRLQEIAKLEKDGQLFEDTLSAFDFLQKIRFKSGLKNRDSGRYIDIEQLSRLQQQTLKLTFKIIHELQNIVRVRFRTDLLGN